MEQTLERYNERNLSDLLIETDDYYIEAYFEWKKEHPMQMATPWPEWI